MTTRLLITLAAALAGWLAILATLSLVSDEAPAFVVVLPSNGMLQGLPQNVAIIDSSSFTVTLASDRPGLARTLYQSGALLVLPSGLSGCAPTKTSQPLSAFSTPSV